MSLQSVLHPQSPHRAIGSMQVDVADGGDKMELLASAERKLNLRILPPLTLLSIICYLDRSNLSFAAVSMNKDLSFTTATYGLGSGLFFLGYATMQIPANLILSRVGASRWIAVICTVWGVVAGCFAAINSRATFLLLRMLLGIAEAGALPGMWYYIAQFYLPARMTIPMTLVMAGITAAQVIGSPLAAALLQMHGVAGLAGWRWLFIIEAIPSVLLGVLLWFLLPDCPAKAWFLTQEERDALQHALDNAAAPAAYDEAEEAHKCPAKLAGDSATPPEDTQRPKRTLKEDWESLLLALRCRIMWCAGVWRLFYAMALYGFTYFTPLILKDLFGAKSTSDTKVVLLSAIPFACAAVLHMCNAMHSQLVGERRLHIVVPWALGGICLFCLPTATNRGTTAAGFAVLTLGCMGVSGADGPDISWITTLMTSEERLLGLPSINMIANVGGFVGPYIIGALDTSTGNYNASEYVMAGCSIAAAALVLVFPTKWSNVPQHVAGIDGAGAVAGATGPLSGTPATVAASAAAAAAGGGDGSNCKGAVAGGVSVPNSEGSCSSRAQAVMRRPSRAATFLAAMAAGANGDTLLACPERVRSRILPALEPAGSGRQVRQRAATFHGHRWQTTSCRAGGGAEAAERENDVELWRAATA